MFFWNKSPKNRHEVDLLEKKLSELRVADISKIDARKLKNRVFTLLSSNNKEELVPYSLRNLILQIREASQKTIMDFVESLRIKEKLLDLIESSSIQTQGRQFGIFGNFKYFRTVFAGIILFVFVLSSVFLVPLKIPVTHASRSTYFEEVTGKVLVLRNGTFLPASVGFSLQEGDVILTKDNGFASVRFFDDSVSRMAENTQIALKRLSSEPFNPVATQIELLLQNGRSWFRVLNLVDEKSLFTVATAQVAASVSKRAAFDLQVHLYENYLSVFDNVVDYSVNNDFSPQTKSLLAGFQAHVSKDGKVKTSVIAENDEDEDDAAKSVEWVKDNLKRDKIHGDSVVAEKEKALTVASSPEAARSEKLNNDDSKVLSNQELEKLRLQFLDSHKRLLLGATFLMRRQVEEGLRLINEFKNTVKELAARLKDLEKTDPMNAGLLRSMIAAKVAQQRKDVATLLPKDALYPLKQILAETEILLADSDVDKIQLQLSYLESRLLEAQALVKSEKFDEAENILKQYERDIHKIVLQVRDNNFDELNSKVVALFNQQIKQIKALTAIEKSLYPMQNRLLGLVRSLRYALLQKVIVASGDVEGSIPVVLLQQMKDLLQTYLSDGAFDKEFVAVLNKLLQKSTNKPYMDAGAPSKLPEDLGVVKLFEGQIPPKFAPDAEFAHDDDNKKSFQDQEVNKSADNDKTSGKANL